MGVREYVGARYVPLFADPLEWDSTKSYEPLTVVYHQGNSYTSRQYVPAGIDITNTAYWALTGNYNAQVESLRQTVERFDGRIDDIEGALPSDVFTPANTVEQSINTLATSLSENIAEIQSELKYKYKAINRASIYKRIDIASSATEQMQGGCYFKQDGNKYIAWCIGTKLTIASRVSGLTIATVTNSSFGHGNQIAYAGRKLYITPLNSANIAVVDINTVSNPVVSILDLSTAGFSDVYAFDAYENDTFVVAENGKIYAFDGTNRTEICDIPTDIPYPGTNQSTRYSQAKKLFYRVSSGISAVTYFNAEGEIVEIIGFEPSYKFVRLGELEDYVVCDDEIAFFAINSRGYNDSFIDCNIFVAPIKQDRIQDDTPNIPFGGLVNIYINNTADGFNDSIAPFPGYGAAGFTFKYPCDAMEFLRKVGATRCTYTLQTDCPYSIPILYPTRIVAGTYHCPGFWITAKGCAFQYTGGQTYWNAIDSSKLVNSGDGKNAYIMINGGGVMIASGPTSPVDYWVIHSWQGEVWCVPNVKNNSFFSQTVGSANMEWI